MPGCGPVNPYSSGWPLTRIGTPLDWAVLMIWPIDLGAIAMTQAAPARPLLITSVSCWVCLVASKFGSCTMTSQPFDLE
jgi:hypothetical protein